MIRQSTSPARYARVSPFSNTEVRMPVVSSLVGTKADSTSAKPMAWSETSLTRLRYRGSSEVWVSVMVCLLLWFLYRAVLTPRYSSLSDCRKLESRRGATILRQLSLRYRLRPRKYPPDIHHHLNSHHPPTERQSNQHRRTSPIHGPNRPPSHQHLLRL